MDQQVKNASESRMASYSVSRGGKTHPERLSDREIAVDVARYDASLAFLDSQLQSLVNFLKQQGLFDNSLLIFTSDHGHSLGEHGAIGHAARWLHDTQVWVPLIMVGPNLLPSGVRIPQQVQLVDLFPTVAALSGYQAGGRSYALQGHSLLPADLAKARRPFSILEAQYWVEGVTNQDREMIAIRTDDYKYIWTPDGADELYNLKLDPAENNNLIDQEPALTR
jgi:arylsulfatase A-like enzyme